MSQTKKHIDALPHRRDGRGCGRFAPSPTGRMHLGNVYSALLAWLSARSQGCEFVLRIEDIDTQRSHREYAEQIDDDLRWLGLDWDERYVQSERFAIYEEQLHRLEEMSLTYPCFCTRADIMASSAPHEGDGRVVHSVAQRIRDFKLRMENGELREQRPVRSIRLKVPDEDVTFVDGHYGEHTVNLASQCGDFILRRADGAWAYQLAVVVDDALMGITEVVRGRDLLLSVPQQIHLFNILGFEAPRYAHLPLLCNEAGQRLSKRDNSLDMGCLRERYSAEEIIGRLAYYAGQIDKPEPITTKELVGVFSWDKVPTEDVFVG